MLLIFASNYTKSVLRRKFLILGTFIIWTLHIYRSKDVRIRGYFSKPKVASLAKNLLETPDPHDSVMYVEVDTSYACCRRVSYL